MVQIHVRAPANLRFWIYDLRAAGRLMLSLARKSSIVNLKFAASVPQQPQERFRKPLVVGASPTRGSNYFRFPIFDWRSSDPQRVNRQSRIVNAGRIVV